MHAQTTISAERMARGGNGRTGEGDPGSFPTLIVAVPPASYGVQNSKGVVQAEAIGLSAEGPAEAAISSRRRLSP